MHEFKFEEPLVQYVNMPLGLNELAADLHNDMRKFWFDEEGNRKDRNKGELIALMHSELSDLLEAERKGLMDENIPGLPGNVSECVSAIIRLLDYAGAYEFDLDGALALKRAYNAVREDHVKEAREGNGLSNV